MSPPQVLAFPPTALRSVAAGRVVGNPVGSSGTRAQALTSAELKAIIEASGPSYLPLSGGTLTGALTGTSITLAQGSMQSGGLSFGGSGGANIYGRGQSFVFATANTNAIEIDWAYTRVARESWIGWSDGSYNASSNTIRAAWYADSLNRICQRNGLNAQTYELFETYTSATSYGSLCLKTTSGGHQIGSARGSAGGSNRAVQLGHFDATGLFTSGLSVATSGEVTCWGNINAGLNIRTGIAAGIYALSGVNLGAGVSSPSDGVMLVTNFNANSFSRLQLGGTTASFPSIKRNGTAVNFRLANDSADCPITAAAITASGQLIHSPSSSVTLASNGQFSIEMTSNTAGNLVYRGSDGTTRRMALTFV